MNTDGARNCITNRSFVTNLWYISFRKLFFRKKKRKEIGFIKVSRKYKCVYWLELGKRPISLEFVRIEEFVIIYSFHSSGTFLKRCRKTILLFYVWNHICIHIFCDKSTRGMASEILYSCSKFKFKNYDILTLRKNMLYD